MESSLRLIEDSSPRSDAATIIAEYCDAALVFAGVEDSDRSMSFLDACLSNLHAPNKRLRIAICLLRLLKSYPDLIALPELRSGRLFDLFDASFGDTALYRSAKITRSDQNFKKAEALSWALDATENDLNVDVTSLSNFAQLPAFRSNYLKKMRGSLVKLLIQPMIPDALGDQRVDALIEQIQGYLGAENADVVRLYQEVGVGLKGYILETEAQDFSYVNRYCLPVAKKLYALVEAHFSATTFSKPAEIKASLGDKKYPLSQAEARFELIVDIDNLGPGYAHDVQLKFQASDDILIDLPSMRLGGLHPSSTSVRVPARVTTPSDIAIIEVSCTWRSQNSEQTERNEIFELCAQRSDIDWLRAATEDPYSLGPVRTADELIGRTEILNRLVALTKGANVESAFIRGQKRVGKTSIAKALASRLREMFPQDYIVVYLEAGDYVTDSGGTTIESLGRQICKAVIRADQRLARISIPTFNGALSPITGFFQDVIDAIPQCRVLIILDEFDELPLDLYRRGLSADAFFRTLRSLSNKDELGFVLVGSEKMEFVLSSQGDALNKFTRIGVDYFDRQHNWADFQDLIRKPTAFYLEFTEPAIGRIYHWSAGNPYFAKLICQALFQTMIQRHDSHVTPAEVDLAVHQTLAHIGGNSFQHFWQDGITEPAPQAEEISIVRRKMLLALGDCLRRANRVSREDLIAAAKTFQLDENLLEYQLRDYQRREVIVAEDGHFRCKVQLFSNWLHTRGYQEILTTFIDHDALLSLRQAEEAARVVDKEILALIDNWGLYQGRRITAADVRAWLNQFKLVREQRLMFHVLKAVNFYSTDRLREKMNEAHRIVMRGTTWKRVKGQPRRRDVIVSAIGGFGKSGTEYARRYADENQIFQDNVVPINQVASLIEKREGVQAVVFLDDFIGTGQSLCDQIREASGTLKELCLHEGLNVFVVCVTGFVEGQRRVEEEIAKHALGISLHICDPLSEADQLFSDASSLLGDSTERRLARDVAYEYGAALVSNAPLGFGGGQAAVVFDNTIPNNSLPILWQRNKAWSPLFVRL